MNVKAWLREFRPLFLLFVALPAALGAAIARAYAPDDFSLPYAAIAIVATVALHAGTVLLNDYFDFRSGADVLNRERTPFSGGSGLLPAGVLRPRSVLAAGLLCFGLSASLGLLIAVARSPLVIAFGLAGLGIGFAYTAPPFRLAYRGLGETARLVATPLMVLGAYVVQAPSFAPAPLAACIAASLPVAFLNTAALYIFQFPDHAADAAVGKRNLVVRLGPGGAVPGFYLLCALAYLSLLAGILAGALPLASASAFVALPLSAVACRGLGGHHDTPKSLVPPMKSASDAYVLACAALIAAFLL